MFLQEKIIDGILSYRHTPTASWQPYTSEKLSEKYQELQEQQTGAVSLKEMAREVEAAVKVAVAAAIVETSKKILAVITTEDELSEEPPLEVKQAFEGMDRIALARVVVKVTKNAIKEKVLARL